MKETEILFWKNDKEFLAKYIVVSEMLFRCHEKQ